MRHESLKALRRFPGISVFSGCFLGFGSVFLPGVSGFFSGGWLGSVSGWFLPAVRPSGRPPPACFFLRPVLVVFFLSCLLHLASFSLG